MVIVHETNDPQLAASYVGGHRQGLLKSYDKSGKPDVVMQYVKGKRDGFGLFFEEGRLRLIAEYDHDAMKGIQLMDDLTPGRAFESPEEAEQDESTRELLKRLNDTLASIKLTEVNAKKELAAAYKEYRSSHRPKSPRVGG